MRPLSRLLAVALLLWCPLAAGAEPTTNPVEAKRHFEAGLKMHKEGAIAEALAEFRLSYRLGGRPSALMNVAQCERDLKNFAAAREAYELLLSEHGDKLGAEKPAVERALGELRVLTGTVAIKADAGVAVEIDGQPVGWRAALSMRVLLGLGPHKLRVTKSGFEPFEKDFALASEQDLVIDVVLTREILTGHVVVREAAGRDVHLFVDGADDGPLPFVGDLPPGEHTLEARGSLFAADKRIINVVRKETVEIILDATPLTGHVRVTATPPAAAIRVDGVEHGTGAWEADLAPGTHRVQVSLEGYPEGVRELSVARGATVVVEIPLVAPVAAGPAMPTYKGAYTRIAPFFNKQFSKSYQLPAGAPADTSAVSSEGLAAALGGMLNIGYNFGVFGVEFAGLFGVTPSGSRFTPASSTYGDVKINPITIHEIIGVEARVTSKHDTIRFTFGMGPAISIGEINFDRSVSNSGGCQGSSGTCPGPIYDLSTKAGYVTGALMADGGILLGGTPGPKFFIGVNIWADFPPKVVVGPDIPSNNTNSENNSGNSSAPVAFPSGYFDAPGRGWKATYGPEFFIGPTLGVLFGH